MFLSEIRGSWARSTGRVNWVSKGDPISLKRKVESRPNEGQSALVATWGGRPGRGRPPGQRSGKGFLCPGSADSRKTRTLYERWNGDDAALSDELTKKSRETLIGGKKMDAKDQVRRHLKGKGGQTMPKSGGVELASL